MPKKTDETPRSMASSFKSMSSTMGGSFKKLMGNEEEKPMSAIERMSRPGSAGSGGSGGSRGSKGSRGSRWSRSSAGSGGPDAEEEITGLQLPVFGFGSARYGLLGPAEKDRLPCEGGDIFETYSDEMRILLGYKGDVACAISAGASHVCVLIDLVEDKGGKVLAHGLATMGRLGVGTQRRKLNITDFYKKKSAEAKEKKGIGVKGYEKSESNPFAPDFTRLPFEKATLPGGALVKDERARYLPKPKRCKAHRPKMLSCGQVHSAVVGEDGKIYQWGLARHGRCGLGKNARMQTSDLDGNDVYAPKVQRIDFPGSRVAYVACGHKHTIACDDRGDTFVWGLARYGRLGIGDFSELPLEDADENGFVDEYSHHQNIPIPIPGLQGIHIGKVFAGAYNSFAISANTPSTVYTWGLSRYGMLGIGDYPPTCCIRDRWDPDVGPEDCPRCKRTPVEKNGVKSFLEEDRGHPHFHRVKITRPRQKEEVFMLIEDPADELDTYVPFPIEVNAFSAVNITEIYAGTYHHLALSDMGHLFAWGLLRHGRCGIGKFDPTSECMHGNSKPKPDPLVPKYPREVKYYVNSKGQYREDLLDVTSFYQPVPKLLESLKTIKIVHAAVGDCHSAAVSFENNLYTWGCARHGRLGDVDDWDHLLRDPNDDAGRYRALPELCESANEIVPIKVACSDTATFVIGSNMPYEWQQFAKKADSKFGWLSDTMSRASRSPGSSRPTSAGSSRVQSRANSRPGSAGSARSDQSPRTARVALLRGGDSPSGPRPLSRSDSFRGRLKLSLANLPRQDSFSRSASSFFGDATAPKKSSMCLIM